MKRLLLLFAVAALLASCLKAGKYRTDYILKPGVQLQSVDASVPLEGVVAYACEVDTLDWGIASYDDAVAGILTRKNASGERLAEPDDWALPYAPSDETDAAEGATAASHWLQLPLGKQPRMVVAVDTQNRLYAYTMQQPALNLPRLYVSVIFQPWKEGYAYKSGNWSVYNDFYTPPTILKAYFRPTWQAEAGGEETAFTSSQLKAYAFLADTTDWYIASYDDAVAGRIVRKGNDGEERTTPNFQAYYENDSALFGMEVTGTPLLAVVVDRINRIYAYTKLTPDLTGESPVWPVLFRPWQRLPRYEEAGWQYVDESAADAGTEEPEEPDGPDEEPDDAGTPDDADTQTEEQS